MPSLETAAVVARIVSVFQHAARLYNNIAIANRDQRGDRARQDLVASLTLGHTSVQGEYDADYRKLGAVFARGDDGSRMGLMTEFIFFQDHLLQSIYLNSGRFDTIELMRASDRCREKSLFYLCEQFRRMTTAAPIANLPYLPVSWVPSRPDRLPLAEAIAVDSRVPMRPRDLGLQPNDLVSITEYIDAEVCKVRSNRTGQVGTVPTWCVTIIKQHAFEPPFAHVARRPPYPQTIALYAYIPRHPGHLALRPGDDVLVTVLMGFHWWTGRNKRTGREGMFPRSCVGVLRASEPAHAVAPPPYRRIHR